MKIIRILTLALLPLALSACNGVGQMNVSGTVNETTTTSSISFAGLQSITSVAGTSMQLNWTNVSGAASYAVYNMTSGSPVYLATVVAPTATYAVTGLSTSTSYTFRVKMTDTSGLVDTNTGNVSATTLSYIATFQGWSNAQALGPKAPAAQATDLSSASAQVTLNWNAVTLNTGSITSYNIYRATTSGGENYSSPLATGITTAAASYTDTSSLTSGTTYYYTVAPVVAGNVIPVQSSADSEISILIPPSNMALIHPWIANQDICGLMGRTTDRTNGYRCSYNGPGNVSSYYNMQTALFVDTYGEGCNYTMDTTNCTTSGCLGTNTTPCTSLTGTNGDVCYDRDLGTCYLKASGSWVTGNTATSVQLAAMMSNAPGLPPFVNVNQSQSWKACQTVTISPYTHAKRLLKHSEQILAAAWSTSLSDVTISALEGDTSGNLNTTHACNAVSGSGLTYSTATLPADLNTLPGEGATGSIYSVRNGSTATTNCVSRYGIQDMVGNVWQWSSDQLASCTNYTCSGITSALDTSNTDWNGFNFDGGAPTGPGPGGVANSGGTLSSGNLGGATFNTFQVPLGLPMVGTYSSTWDGITIGAGAGQFSTTKFHGNYLYLYADSAQGAARGAFAGGVWNDGSNGGRFALDLGSAPTVAYNDVGFRCALPAD